MVALSFKKEKIIFGGHYEIEYRTYQSRQSFLDKNQHS